MYIYICIYTPLSLSTYIYETYAWTPNNVFLSKIVVGSILCNFKWTSKHLFYRDADIRVGWFWGLGT